MAAPVNLYCLPKSSTHTQPRPTPRRSICTPSPASSQAKPDKVLGRVKVPLMEAAAAGRLRGAWPLQGALEGQLEMALEWIEAGSLDGAAV